MGKGTSTLTCESCGNTDRWSLIRQDRDGRRATCGVCGHTTHAAPGGGIEIRGGVVNGGLHQTF
ncbi:hypothetical protein AB0M79_15040 [Polymorphospora sp. NPDC051019]|uniref:hypothetical protein n=1 Tax=Polymorphospora sp. NPDC051019 TaxID=3155725 RepID=UPI003427045D